MSLDPRREGRLTASNFGAAIGINPYMSRQKLFRTLKGREPKFEGNEMTEWGNLHEMTAVNAYEADQGVTVLKSGNGQEFVIGVEHDWMGCTPDGFAMDDKIVEVKCPWSKMYSEIPAYYMAQIQGQMAITGEKSCDFVVWFLEDKEGDTADAELAVWRVEFSEEYWAVELELLKKFWASVQADEEPKRSKKPVMPDVHSELLF
jgi:putative phage-type endonuclease